MQLNQSLVLGSFALLVSTLPLAGQWLPSRAATMSQVPITSGPPQFASPRAEMVAMTGLFMAAEHPTTGSARIVTEGGHRYLELSSAFSTSSQGPDLHVLLDPVSAPPQSYSNMNQFINLGRLRSYDGTQRYPIPDSVNITNIKSVVIWCRMANATFGYAPLRKTDHAMMY